MRFMKVYFLALLVCLCYPEKDWEMFYHCCKNRMCLDRCDFEKVSSEKHTACMKKCYADFKSKWQTMMIGITFNPK
ncbi:unnamed protein product [Cylicocyclus nassatus]|uniref:Uncharacterized protein n=1 Tax=Cylicocyclus nassatus TaxID=53992 RepID=A0AA36DSN1_CYLNA|nr:unnamed protein product [Cylicocyclus nassatus]